MLRLFRSVCRGNFLKHSECFERIPNVFGRLKPSKLSDPCSQKPLKTFGLLRKASKAYIAGRLSIYFKPHIFLFRRNDLPHKNTDQDHDQKHIRRRQQSDSDNDARYSLIKF